MGQLIAYQPIVLMLFFISRYIQQYFHGVYFLSTFKIPNSCGFELYNVSCHLLTCSNVPLYWERAKMTPRLPKTKRKVDLFVLISYEIKQIKNKFYKIYIYQFLSYVRYTQRFCRFSIYLFKSAFPILNKLIDCIASVR